MADDLKIGFLCQHNPLDRGPFSGVPYYAYQTLQQTPGVDVRLLGRHRAPVKGLLGKVKRRLVSPYTPRIDDIDEAGLDVIVGLVSSDLVYDVGPKLRTPMVHISDATPQFLREFYASGKEADAEAREIATIPMLSALIFSSQYMADRAESEFELHGQDKVRFIPFGINLDHAPQDLTIKPSLETVSLLFIGKDWDRKGGPTAIAAIDVLRARGVAATLTVIGCSPEAAKRHPHVEVLGFVDKNRPDQMAIMEEAMQRAHFSILPTQGDCNPLVIGETNAYGCPMLITNTGGTESLLIPDQNGRLFDPAATGEDFADAVIALTQTRAQYDALSKSSFEHCHARMVWSVWGTSLRDTLRDFQKAGRLHPPGTAA